MLQHSIDRFLRWHFVEIQHTNRFATGRTASAADRHLRDVHPMLPKIVPTAPMMPGTSSCVKTSRMPSR